MNVASLIESVLGADAPVAFRAYDGSSGGPAGAPATLVLRSPDALRRLVTAPNEVGFGRAYVAGDLDIEGDMFAALELRNHIAKLRLNVEQWRDALLLVGTSGLRPLPPPKEEAHLRGRRHSKQRDAAAIAHHYDVSNEFYRHVLGPSMTYSCAVFSTPTTSLEDAQAAKYELVCTKLGLRPGMRLLDIGCGWGGMAVHAAKYHGAQVVGVTVSGRQAELAEKRAVDADVADLVEIRLQDYRDVHDGPFDAISSIGMFEHVGLSQLETYFEGCNALLRPGGRLLNHAIARPGAKRSLLGGVRPRFARQSFVDRFVFPDGELHEVGSVVSAMQRQGFEARHSENLREHYALTLRRWVHNLEANWHDAVAEAGVGRARVWRLYMAASAVNFEDANIQIHQVLGVKGDHGRSGMPLRPSFS
ncbi:MAG: cfa [Actinomycetia bacterium]|nr:cfa [Actinomycetes bacterium]